MKKDNRFGVDISTEQLIIGSKMSENSYVSGIDGLRAVAVLSVLIFHFNHLLLPGGFIGVDIFFVISGYVIGKSLAANFDKSFVRFIVGFYKRRLVRIMPALTFCLVLTAVFSTMFVPTSWLSTANEKTSLWAFFGLSNFALVSEADGYFSRRVPFNPFVHTWSLAVEEQFYFIFPILFYFFLLKRQHCHKNSVTGLLLPLIALASICYSSYETNVHPERAFYLLPSRFWQLAAGALLFQAQMSGLKLCRGPISNTMALLAGSSFLIIGFFTLGESNFPFPWALTPVVGTLLLISAMSEGSSLYGLNRAFESKPAIFLGKISFSLYLWHWPVFVLFRWTVGMEGAITGSVAVILSFGLATFSYFFIENPARRSKFVTKSSAWVVVISMLAMTLITYATTSRLYERNSFPNLRLSITEDYCIWRGIFQPNCSEKSSPQPSLSALVVGRTILIAGDSHAGTYNHMVNEAANEIGAEVVSFTKAGCPIADLISPRLGICGDVNEPLIETVKRVTKPGDIVFLASLRMPRFRDQGLELRTESDIFKWLDSSTAENGRKSALIDAENLVGELLALKRIVLFDAPKPVFKSAPFRCSDWFNSANPACDAGFTVSKSTLEQIRLPFLQSLRQLDQHPDFHVWDAFPLLCPGEVCSSYFDRKPLMSDGDHLSGFGNRFLTDSFIEALLDIWADELVSIAKVDLRQKVAFFSSTTSDLYLGRGWYTPESWGVWSAGDRSVINIPIANDLPSSIVIEVQALVNSMRPSIQVEALVNDIIADTWTFEARDPITIEVALTPQMKDIISSTGILNLTFRYSEVVPATEIGFEDQRTLTVGLVSIELR